MSLGRALDGVLAPGTARVEGDGRRAEVDVVDVDRLGVSVRGVRVRGDHAGDVARHAERLPDAVRVLPESVVPVEVDPALGGAVLRSDPEEVVDHEFFEVRTDGREVCVERLRRGDAGVEHLPFTLTREQLGKLVDGLGGVVAEDFPKKI
ncbi:MAG: hypothetical protein ACOZNI_23425 [Myxococcota bacterium]